MVEKGLIICALFIAAVRCHTVQTMDQTATQHLNNKLPASGLPSSQVVVASRTGGDLCNGVLIDLDYVVCAAHCVNGEKPETLQVVADEPSIRQTKRVYHIFVHPDYIPATKANDIAVLKIGPFTPSKSIRLARLALNSPAADSVCNLVVRNGEQLLFVSKLAIADFKACNASHNGALSSTHFCTMFSPPGSCQGKETDGSLECSDGEVSGIVAITSACMDTGRFGVFVDVSQFSDFVDESMRTPVEVTKYDDETGSATSFSATSISCLLPVLVFLVRAMSQTR